MASPVSSALSPPASSSFSEPSPSLQQPISSAIPQSSHQAPPSLPLSLSIPSQITSPPLASSTTPSFTCQRCRQSIIVISESSHSAAHNYLSADPASPHFAAALIESYLASSAQSKLKASFSASVPSSSASGPQLPSSLTRSDRSQSTPHPVSASQISSSHRNPSNASQQMQMVAAIYEYASEKTEIDHPLCLECNDILLHQLEREQRDIDKDLETYRAFLAQLQAEERKEMDDALFTQKIRQLDKEEHELRSQLQAVQQERSSLQQERIRAEAEAEELEHLEERYWKEFNDFQFDLEMFLEERDALKQRISIVSTEYDRLKKTNVYNDAFHIWFDGHFGTINGFRLGRLPAIPVEWHEINAALGHVALLVHTMAKNRGVSFSRFQILPMGSFSKIRRIDSGDLFEFYGGVGGLFSFSSSRFDKAMVGFLFCLDELAKSERQRGGAAVDPIFKDFYSIDNDKINNFSVKLFQGNSDEKWTKSMKYMLTNCKLVLSSVARS